MKVAKTDNFFKNICYSPVWKMEHEKLLQQISSWSLMLLTFTSKEMVKQYLNLIPAGEYVKFFICEL